MTAKKTTKNKKSKKAKVEEKIAVQATVDEHAADVSVDNSVLAEQPVEAKSTPAKKKTSTKSKKTGTYLSNIMNELKSQNPMATWKNVFLGFAVVMLVVVSSLIYFNKLASNTVATDATKQIEVEKPQIPENTPLNVEKEEVEEEFTTVLEGEGLWNVAERVCKDGEKYVVLAQANGLDSEAAVTPGQKLLVKCN